MSKLILKNINKVYLNGFQAVYDFNLEIEDGEFIVLVGPSGCGKSTTLRMIAGLEDITKGEFYINDKLSNTIGPRERGVAMVFQSYALYPHLTVYENMAFGLELAGFDEEVIEKRVINTYRILGLEPYLERKPRELSGGQRQRVAVGRAIIRHVDIFLMDEPLSNLDAKQRVTMRSEIIDIHRSIGATTIYVTHDQTEAMTMADRIVVMKDGYIQQVGTPHDLYFEPNNMFVAGFIGEPPMNFIEGDIIGNNFIIKDTDININIEKFPILNTYKELIFGFRPEAIQLKKNQKVIDGITLIATVELTELLGDSTNVYVNIDKHNVILKVDPHDTPNIGETCEFTIPCDAIYWFDKKSEKVIK